MDFQKTLDTLLKDVVSEQVSKRVSPKILAEHDALKNEVSFLQRTLSDTAAGFDKLSAGLRSALKNGAVHTNGTAVVKNGNGHTRKALDMKCRVPGCFNRSKGPRFSFICETHLKKLSKKELAHARAEYKRKHEQPRA